MKNKGLLFVFVLVAFVLFFQTTQAAEIELTACVNLTNADNATNTYIWNKSVTNSGDAACINITQSNIEIICSNHSNFIDGDDSSNDKGIKIRHANNVTIRDCNMTDWYYGFYLYNVTNLNLTNVSLYSSPLYDVYAEDVANMTIKKSIFNSSANDVIYMTLDFYSKINTTVIEENTFTSSGSATTDEAILYLEYAVNSTINNNTFTSNGATEIFISGGANNTISNNTFSGNTKSSSCGIKVDDNEFISNNNLTGLIGSSNYGICLTGTANTFKNNLVKNYSRNVFITSNLNSFENLNSSSGTYGVYIGKSGSNVYNNTFFNCKIKNSSYGIYFYDSSGASVRGNVIKDSVVNGSEFNDVLSDARGASVNMNNTLLNVTFGSVNVTNTTVSWTVNEIYVQWYLDVQVIYENGSYASGATVNISGNSTFISNITFTTNANGFITQQNITDYRVNYTNAEKDTKNYLNNYTIHVYKEGSNSSQVNFSQSENTLVNLTITNVSADTTKPAITIHSPENTSYVAGTTSLGFNVSLDEDGSWCGYSLNEAANVTMTQFNVTYYNYSKTSLTAGSYNVTFSCNDTSNNFNVTSIVFTIAASGGNGGGNGGGGGGGTQPTSYCGDEFCNIDENCVVCPEDCGECEEPGPEDPCENLTLQVTIDLGFEKEEKWFQIAFTAIFDFIKNLF